MARTSAASTRGAIPYLRRNLGLVFQDQKLLFDRNAFDNVMLPLSITGFPPAEAARRVRAALDKVGLLAREKAMPIMLSGGEQQRLAIARAVVSRPNLLLADEPTAHLDQGPRRTWRASSSNSIDVGVTVFIATYDDSLFPGTRRLRPRPRTPRVMNAWLAQHWQAFRLALRRLVAAPVNTLLSLLAIGVALALPAGGQMLFANALQVARGAAPTPQISLFLDLGADQARQPGRRSPAEEPSRREVGPVSSPREDTLTRMKASEGLGDVIDALPKNPFPDAFVVAAGRRPPGSHGATGQRSSASCPRWRMCNSTRPGCGDWTPC